MLRACSNKTSAPYFSVLKERGVNVFSSNGSLFNEPWTIKNKTGTYFKVFTPYWRHCLQQGLAPFKASIVGKPNSPKIPHTLFDWDLLPKKPNWAAEFDSYWQPGEDGALKQLDSFIINSLAGYKEQRNIPSQQATSRLSPHLHFGK